VGGRVSRVARIEALRRVECLRTLPAAELAAVADAAALRGVPAGRGVGLRAERPVAQFVVVGRVRLFRRAPGGREVTVARVEPGQVVDVGFVLDETTVGLRAEAATDATLCCVDAEWLLGALSRQPEAMLGLVRQIVERLMAAEVTLDQQAGVNARGRVAAALLRVDGERGRPLSDGRRLVEGVTHQAIARQAGVSRETVSRVLGRLRTSGLVLRDGRRYVLPRPARLAELAASA
jgi:CRP-like cAMP-binding protein